MKRTIVTQAGAPKSSPPGEHVHDPAVRNARQPRSLSPATAPSWAKYIDSRLKQFERFGGGGR